MSTIIAIKGTNGSGKSSVVRALMEHLGKAATLTFNTKEAGYRCRYGEQAVFVLGKYKSACGGLDSSFSYKGAADDLLLCIDKLAAKGHVVCEGVIAITSYGFGRVTRFADKQKRKGNHDLCPYRYTRRTMHRTRTSTAQGSWKPEAVQSRKTVTQIRVGIAVTREIARGRLRRTDTSSRRTTPNCAPLVF
jgi:hypothetical protein